MRTGIEPVEPLYILDTNAVPNMRIATVTYRLIINSCASFYKRW